GVAPGAVPPLRGDVPRHRIHVLGQLLPGAGDAGHLRLTTQGALGAHLARDAGDLRGEGAQLVHHLVDRFLQLEDLALRRNRDLAREVAAGHRRGHQGDVADLVRQVAREHVDVVGEILPHAGYAGNVRLRAEATFRAHFL